MPEDESNGDSVSPQLLPNVEHLGRYCDFMYLFLQIYLNIRNFCGEHL